MNSSCFLHKNYVLCIHAVAYRFMHLAPIGIKVNKVVLQETFDEPSNAVGKPSKVENWHSFMD